MASAVLPELGDSSNGLGWLQLEKKAAREMQDLAIKSSAAMATLLYLMARMGRSNRLVVSQQAIADELGVNIRSVSSSVKLLREHRYIEIIKVGALFAYGINSRVAWQGKRGDRYARFGAEVIAIEREQDEPVDNRPSLRGLPKVRRGLGEQ